VILAEIPQAAGVMSVLCAAGMDSGDVHAWFHRRRGELAGVSPALALMTPGRGPGRLVLALARADALELSETGAVVSLPVLPKHAWEGSE
jgi:hypothetical protein